MGMTRPRRPRPWDPLDLAAWLFSAAAGAPVSGLRRLVVGRRLTVPLADGNLTLTVTEFDSRTDVRALSAGQLGEVRLAARDIRWGTSRFATATAVLHNVAIRPSVPPVLVAAQVEMTVDVPAPALDEWFSWAAPRFRGRVGPDGTGRLHLARRPRLGHLEIDCRLDGTTVALTPRRLALGRRRLRLPARIPSYRVRLAELPHGVQLTGIAFAPHLLRLEGILPHWRMTVPPLNPTRPVD